MQAKKIVMNGVPNLWKVSDRLYRSAQPNRDGFYGLGKIGIKTIINLRFLHDDIDVIDPYTLGTPCLRVQMACWHPEIEDIIKFFDFLNAYYESPVLVHCKHGSDRTGSMVALYRIIIEGWPPKDAIGEMLLPQFGFHDTWENLVDWIKGIDIEKIKKQLT